MSQEEPTNRRQKKALRDAERHRKGKKRKHAETVEDGLEDGPDQADEAAQDAMPLEPGHAETFAKKAPKLTKRAQSETEGGNHAIEVVDGAQPGASKAKKRKQVKPPAVEGTGDEVDAPDVEKKHKDRFIVFVGNLPYNTTDASLATYFQKLAPSAIRHRRDPTTQKSKGFAFLEFEGYDRMKTCLKLYHHSLFDPDDYTGPETDAGKGKKKGKGPRRINVELTAGGGGKKEGRMEKIKAKNARLEEQRKRRMQQEQKEKARSDRKTQSGKNQARPEQSEAKAVDAGEGNNADIHPSRLARIKG